MTPIVVLASDQTSAEMAAEHRHHAISLAMRRTLSPHEWDWSPSEAATMASFVLWAHQRLAAIEQLATGSLTR